jgi:hypothetical protein
MIGITNSIKLYFHTCVLNSGLVLVCMGTNVILYQVLFQIDIMSLGRRAVNQL